jgi:hypothetical protein
VQLAESRSPKSYYAEIEARRFSHSELHEFLTVWFPRMSAFVVMRGGTLSSVVPEDRAMDIVGQFFVRLCLDDKERWNAFFIGTGNMAARAGSVNMSTRSLYRWKDCLMEKLADELP